ncbi:MAG: hypothetical protein EOO27_46620 [Comamonadaceae bacterium]|nr:MAG: hypothetical protein EOO27_46620 [Comamonadaceae bacterium]
MAVRTPFNRRRSGNTKPANQTQGDRSGVVHESTPRMPHERDESSDSQRTAPRADMEQAGKDLKRGLVDTDRGPVTDSTYKRLKSDD